jgi:hypothetical protein
LLLLLQPMSSLQVSPGASALLRALAALSLIGGAGGCSFLFSQGPPPGHESLPYFDCTSTRLFPVLDLALAGVFSSATISAATDSSEGSANAAVVSAVVAGTAFVSAARGLVVAEHCIEAKRALEVRALSAPTSSLRGFAAAPGPGPDPWLAAGPPPSPIPGTVFAPPPVAPSTPEAPDGAAP